jgi:hypothetical protein
MNKVTLQITVTIETSQMNVFELANFVKNQLEDANGTEYQADVLLVKEMNNLLDK